MGEPLTADERERRTIEYLRSLHKGQLAEFKLTRLNKLANCRRMLRELIEEMIEMRAEDLAAGMLMEDAPKRPKRLRSKVLAKQEGRKLPVWIAKSRFTR
jgi:hypothetical protein